MLQKDSINLRTVDPIVGDWPWPTKRPDSQVYRHEMSGSGGYSDYLFKNAAAELFGLDQPDVLTYKTLRNVDFREITLERDGKPILRFAIANGFRNIQNLVQKLKRGKSDYHFVEVMACPSGCLNGGAQIRPQEGVTTKELIGRMEVLYRALPKSTVNSPETQFFYDTYLDGVGSDRSNDLLHTSYHAVEKMNTALNIKW